MILMFTHKQDYSVKVVSEWIDFLGLKFKRLNIESDSIKLLEVKSNLFEFVLEIDGEIIESNQITSIWYRGGAVRLQNFIHDLKSIEKRENFRDCVYFFLSSYSVAKLEFVLDAFKEKNVLGDNACGRYNKLQSLKIAVGSGLDVPATLVTTSKLQLIEFYKKHKHLISKSLDMNFKFMHIEANKSFHQYTSEVSAIDIQEYPNSFPLTLFQEKIEKKYEIRVFYLNGKCYSMAILSQLNTKTEVDYRRYDYKRMNRVLTFKLPLNIENKIHMFMRKISMKTGSIDIIRSIDNKFIFLEINPIGQFGYVSEMCNYYLELKIAGFLTNEYKVYE